MKNGEEKEWRKIEERNRYIILSLLLLYILLRWIIPWKFMQISFIVRFYSWCPFYNIIFYYNNNNDDLYNINIYSIIYTMGIKSTILRVSPSKRMQIEDHFFFCLCFMFCTVVWATARALCTREHTHTFSANFTRICSIFLLFLKMLIFLLEIFA